MAANTNYQIAISVEGIQAYLTATGKLNEMIGASELTASFPEKALTYCKDTLHLDGAESPKETQDWYVLLQKGAGELRLVLPTEALAKKLLGYMSLWSIEECPGLPLYSACVPCEWTLAGLDAAKQNVRSAIAKKRALYMQPSRSMWPFCRLAPLDALPAVDAKSQGDGTTAYFSIETLGRSKQTVLEAAQERFKYMEAQFRQPYTDFEGKEHDAIFGPSMRFEWFSDIEKMLAQSTIRKIALLHMDGNDLGLLFRSTGRAAREEALKMSGNDESAAIKLMNKRMFDLSNLVDDANEYAFKEAMLVIVAKDLEQKRKYNKGIGSFYTVPARPLVLGGDDLSIIIQADLAFDFAQTYAAAFETYTRKHNTPMSVGGGMVIIPSGYAFSHAYDMVDALATNAKKLTSSYSDPKKNEMHKRPSSLDYLVVTNDMDSDIKYLRKMSYTARDGSILTGKPFLCGKPCKEAIDTIKSPLLEEVLADTKSLQENFPINQLRRAIDECRNGKSAGKKAFKNFLYNLELGMGKDLGTKSKSKSKALRQTFDRIFPDDNFFIGRDGTYVTLLGDYLELRRILYPISEEA